DLVFSFEVVGNDRSYLHTVDTAYIKENIRFNMGLKNLAGDVLNYHVGQLVTEALGLDFDLNVPAVVTLMIDGQPADMSQYVYGRDSNDKELRVRVGRYGNFSPLLIPELWSLSAFIDEYFTSVIAFSSRAQNGFMLDDWLGWGDEVEFYELGLHLNDGLDGKRAKFRIFYAGEYVDTQEFVFKASTGVSDDISVEQMYLPGMSGDDEFVSIKIESPYMLMGDVVAVNPITGYEEVLKPKYRWFRHKYGI